MCLRFLHGMSATTCPIFRPSLEEFSDFKSYIRKVDADLVARGEKYGICKIVPPTGISGK